MILGLIVGFCLGVWLSPRVIDKLKQIKWPFD
jgi:hypothetical protein